MDVEIIVGAIIGIAVSIPTTLLVLHLVTGRQFKTPKHDPYRYDVYVLPPAAPGQSIMISEDRRYGR